ncbi:MAG TPA: superoxide dismutase [Micromonosporaceae bacterium]|nr:superoxide dismutase [Micromonosporaceae bacterium]HCU48578.1 superoxide dismutase [Micromonosporaceae bacterium]
MFALGSLALSTLLAAACAILAENPVPAEPKTADTAFAVIYAPGVTAITYDITTVPPAGRVQLSISSPGEPLKVTLAVTGLAPDRVFGAHLHTKSCAPTGAGAGPHYQHRPDPAANTEHPSVDPAYTNAENEVWLDFRTDDSGRAGAASAHEWSYDAGRAPLSLIIHAEATKTGPGQAGQAGARLACVNLP